MQASDLEIAAREIMRVRSGLEDILVHHTGQSVEKIRADTDRDYWMTANEALEYGIVDHIVERHDATDGGP